MLEQLISTISIAIMVVLIYMTTWYLFAILIKRNDVADIAWGLGFVLVAITSTIFNQNINTVSIMTLTLVSIWGLRLSWHITKRNIAKPEDYRYKKWRKDWGEWFYLRSYFQIFMLQGLLMLIISLPIFIITTYSTQNINLLVIVGLAVWIIGFVFESVGDWQLKQFTNNPINKGKIMQAGLWRHSRHPNYFGEIVQWWGLGIIALPYSYGILVLLGPLTITFLIVKVSGIPLLEQKYANNPEYQKYIKNTPILIPYIK